MERFSRLTQLIGNEKIKILAKKKVAIIGLGAVGGFAAEALARCGTGHLTLVDFDVIEVSNINRHIAAFDSTVGKPKVDVMGERIKDINPLCLVSKKNIFADKNSFDSIFAEKPDMVIDAIDSLGPKADLLAYCVANKIAIVSSMGAALKKDPSKIKIADISKTDVCPLAKKLRNSLKQKGITEGITVIYSTEPAIKTGLKLPHEDDKLDQEDVKGRKRSILGSYPVVTAMFGLYAAHAAMLAIIGD
ncbi:MAG: tRNA threonylcarbamoyladenosine dehydratase [Spirochaetaceae bacterium]|nr:tRNA threonylcarbamoyladenosine dehydratase [Spirochaetaceae bacterium]